MERFASQVKNLPAKRDSAARTASYYARLGVQEVDYLDENDGAFPASTIGKKQRHEVRGEHGQGAQSGLGLVLHSEADVDDVELLQVPHSLVARTLCQAWEACRELALVSSLVPEEPDSSLIPLI
jgi:hypothetical protein